jgi:hypothetical protein
MNKLLLILSSVVLLSCADASKRMEYLKKTFPKSKVEPSTGLIQQNGYQFVVIDSTNQIIAVEFYPFSETKIQSLRNIR